MKKDERNGKEELQDGAAGKVDEREEKKPAKIIFLATYPDKKKGIPSFMKELEKDDRYVILHPLYAYDSEKGREVLRKLANPYPPKGASVPDTIMRQDLYGVGQSHVMVYDIDVDPGVQFLTAAVLNCVPVVGVSGNLSSMYEYFSGAVEAVVKPESLSPYLEHLFLKIDVEQPKADPNTVARIEKVLSDHLEKAEA
jgi:hypothetical protein